MNLTGDLSQIKYNTDGLVPVVAQDVATGAVLMLAWANGEALRRTVETGQAHYYSRSRQELWHKGATSGHIQIVYQVLLDCDSDSVLYRVEQAGGACHTGSYSCFERTLAKGDEIPPGFETLAREFAVILDRKANPKEGSYTNYLFDKGIEKICKKVGEEASEVIIAAMKGNAEELRYEAADLIYHLMVAMAHQGLSWKDILSEIDRRK